MQTFKAVLLLIFLLTVIYFAYWGGKQQKFDERQTHIRNQAFRHAYASTLGLIVVLAMINYAGWWPHQLTVAPLLFGLFAFMQLVATIDIIWHGGYFAVNQTPGQQKLLTWFMGGMALFLWGLIIINLSNGVSVSDSWDSILLTIVITILFLVMLLRKIFDQREDD